MRRSNGWTWSGSGTRSGREVRLPGGGDFSRHQCCSHHWRIVLLANRPIADEPASTWPLWCGLPAAALLLALSRTPLWLTMPAAPEEQALQWVLAAEGVALFALGAGRGIRSVTTRFLASVVFLVVGWAVAGTAVTLFEAVTALTLATAAIAIFTCRLPAGWLALRAIIVLALGYRMLA